MQKMCSNTAIPRNRVKIKKNSLNRAISQNRAMILSKNSVQIVQFLAKGRKFLKNPQIGRFF